jgi:beta-N-acetylhexosaminidase
VDSTQQIGEMFLAGFAGTTITKDIEDLIVKYRIGGVILFSRNITSIGQAAKLCGELQDLRKSVSGTPLFIAIDQEGGVVQRIVEGLTVLPGNMAIGSVGVPDCAYAAGRITAVELGCIGVNVNFAPVVDISNNPDNPSTGVRSFGGDPDTVAELASQMITGFQGYGLIACAKHFPGKGNVSVDSHLDLPLNTSRRDALRSCELKPFAAAIAAQVDMIMTAHVMYPALTENEILPATLSRNIMTGLLRDELGFKGVLITDDMEMGAIAKYFTLEESVVKAVAAGVDIVMVCHTVSKQREALAALKKAVDEGAITRERIDESVARITALKKKITHTKKHPEVTGDTIPFHHLIAERIARDSITIQRNDTGGLPLYLNGHDRLLVIVPRYETLTQVEEKTGEDDIILEEFRIRHENVTVVHVGLSPSAKDYAVFREIRAYKKVVLFTYNAHLNGEQLAFARKLLSVRKDAVIAAVRNPYDLSKLPEAETTVATYGFRNCSLRALVEVLFGEIEAKGKMPVSL